MENQNTKVNLPIMHVIRCVSHQGTRAFVRVIYSSRKEENMSPNDDELAIAAATAAREGNREERTGQTTDLNALMAKFAAANPPVSHSDEELTADDYIKMYP